MPVSDCYFLIKLTRNIFTAALIFLHTFTVEIEIECVTRHRHLAPQKPLGVDDCRRREVMSISVDQLHISGWFFIRRHRICYSILSRALSSERCFFNANNKISKWTKSISRDKFISEPLSVDRERGLPISLIEEWDVLDEQVSYFENTESLLTTYLLCVELIGLQQDWVSVYQQVNGTKNN